MAERQPPPGWSICPSPARIFLATCGAEVYTEGDDLNVLIAEVQSSLDPQAGEEVAIWRGSRLVAVVRAGGSILLLVS